MDITIKQAKELRKKLLEQSPGTIGIVETDFKPKKR